MHNVIAILILLSLNLLYLLDIIGCIFIFLRVGKIYGHSNEKRMSLRIKFPFYLAVTYYLLAILGTCSINISALCTHNSCTVGSIIIDNIAEIILAINLFLGTILTLQTWIILKNNYKLTYSWGKKNYIFWLIIIITIIISITLSIIDFLIKRIFFISLFAFVIYPIFLIINICFLLKIHLKLNNLDQSVNYNFNISELKKLRSYILLFIYQWIIIVIVIVYNLYLKLLFYKYWIFDLTYAMGGILHFILFINNEGFFFDPDSVVQQQDIHLSVENR
ncbi:unnamed protein product [Rhizophagus irregularis]|nr:unnamed protein product [Rhizophagus irregularis]